MRKTRIKALSALLLAGCLALTACGGGASSGSSGSAPAQEEKKEEAPAAQGPAQGETQVIENASDELAPDNDFVVALQADTTNLDPHVSGNGISNLISDTMYEGLITWDTELNIIPSLAEKWEVSDDGLSYTFHLKQGVKFHDGEDFNAAAFVANYQRAVDDNSLRLFRQVRNWKTCTAEDDYTVVITLETPNNTFLNKLTQVRIVSPKAFEGKDTATASTDLSKASAGTGPYILNERQDGGYTKVVANADYWGTAPALDSLTFQVVPEDGARVAMLQTGEADLIYPVPPINADNVSKMEGVRLINNAGITYRYATLNRNVTLADGRKPLDDVRVRQAMNYAFDSEAYAKAVFQGFARVPTSCFAASIPYYSEQTPYSLDLEKAKALMAEAGFEDGFPVKIICDNTTIEMQGAEFFKQQMAQINIDVEVVAQESTVNADMAAEPEATTKVEIWYVNWSSGSYEADGSMRAILHKDNFPDNGGYNTAFWANDEFSKLLDDALVASTSEEAAKLYADAQAIAWEECPWVFLGNDNNIAAERTYVSGVKYLEGGHMLFHEAALKLQ